MRVEFLQETHCVNVSESYKEQAATERSNHTEFEEA